MKIKEHPNQGYGKSVSIMLSGNEVAIAIGAYLEAHDVHVVGPRTISVNGNLITCGRIYVDPSGSVIRQGKKYPSKESDK